MIYETSCQSKQKKTKKSLHNKILIELLHVSKKQKDEGFDGLFVCGEIKSLILKSLFLATKQYKEGVGWNILFQGGLSDDKCLQDVNQTVGMQGERKNFVNTE